MSELFTQNLFTQNNGGGSLLGRIIIKDSVIPEASAKNAGYMYIYTGETNSTYTHGYIYENQYVPSYEGSITFTPSTVTVTEENFSAFLNEWKQYLPNPTAITHGTFTYDAASKLWRLEGFDADNNQVGVLQLYQQDYEDGGFVFSGTFEDGYSLTFVSTITTSSSSYQWVRIDVQPGGGSVKFVPALPANGESQYIYGVVRDELSREGYAIVQLFMWYNNNWCAAGAFDVDIDPDQLVYKDNIPVATASTFGGVKVEFDETTGTLNIKTE